MRIMNFFQDFVPCTSECEEKVKILSDNKRSNDYDVCKNFLFFCQIVNGEFGGLVINFERTNTKWFRLSENWTTLQTRCQTNKIRGNGLYKLSEFCVVYAKEFLFFNAYWYISIAGNQIKVGLNMMQWNNGFILIDW